MQSNSLKLSSRRCVGPVDWWLCKPLKSELIKPGEKGHQCDRNSSNKHKIQDFRFVSVWKKKQSENQSVLYLMPLFKSYIFFKLQATHINYQTVIAIKPQNYNFPIRCYFLVHMRLCKISSVMWLSKDWLLLHQQSESLSAYSSQLRSLSNWS